MITLTALILVTILVVICVLYYWVFQKSLSKKLKVLLIVIRTLICICLLCALTQPAINLHLVRQNPKSVVVLIDASKSMKLFSPDSVIKPLLNSLTMPTNNSYKKQFTFEFYCFGDSLRRCHNLNSLNFDDNRSFFPLPFFQNRLLHNRRVFVIVSDGAWSNSSLSYADMKPQNKYFYVRLPFFFPRPYITFTIGAHPSTIKVREFFETKFIFSGYSEEYDTLTLSCFSEEKEKFELTHCIGKGYFHDTASLKICASKPNKNLFRCILQSHKTGLKAECNFVITAISDTLIASVFHTTSPSLDSRFILLALRQVGNWRVQKSPNSSTDVLFCFGYDSTTERKIESLSSKAVAVIIGSSATTKSHPISVTRFSIIPRINAIAYLPAKVFVDFPPPQRLFGSSNLPPIIDTILLASYTSGNTTGNLPLMYTTKIKNHRCLVIAAEGVWRWSFWPLLFREISEEHSFFPFILSAARHIALENTSNRFIFYVAKQPFYETDSIRFNLIMPSTVTEAHHPCSLNISLKKISGSETIDTTFFILPSASPFLQLTLPPLKWGRYITKAVVHFDRDSASCSDSINVTEDISEYFIDGQNMLILNQFAHSLPANADSIVELLNEQFNEYPLEASPTSIKFRLLHSWFLLVLIFLLLGTEWFLRRKMGMD